MYPAYSLSLTYPGMNGRGERHMCTHTQMYTHMHTFTHAHIDTHTTPLCMT